MRVFCLRWMAALAIGVLATLSGPSDALAYVGNVRIAPTSPTAGKPILVKVSVGGCQAFLDDIDAVRKVERSGSRIDVTIEGTSFVGGCEDFPAYDRQFPIGTLPAGSYELHFYFLESPDSTEVGSLQFEVSNPTPIPASGLAAACVAMLGIVVVACATLRIRKTTRTLALLSAMVVLPLRSAGLLLALAIAPGVATAYVGNVRVAPLKPLAGKPIDVVVSIGDCHFFVDHVGAFREVKRVGNRIDVTIEGFIGFATCEGLPAHDRSFPIGALPAGHYELHFHFLDGLDSTEVGSVGFTVSGARTIPATGTTMMSVMAIGMLLIAVGGKRSA